MNWKALFRILFAVSIVINGFLLDRFLSARLEYAYCEDHRITGLKDISVLAQVVGRLGMSKDHLFGAYSLTEIKMDCGYKWGTLYPGTAAPASELYLVPFCFYFDTNGSLIQIDHNWKSVWRR